MIVLLFWITLSVVSFGVPILLRDLFVPFGTPRLIFLLLELLLSVVPFGTGESAEPFVDSKSVDHIENLTISSSRS